MTDQTVKAMILRAEFPHPPGINRTYRSGRNGWYMTPAATSWLDSAIFLLRGSGFRLHDPAMHWIGIYLTLHTCALDVDAPTKLAVDAVSKALGVDDSWFGLVSTVKILVADRELQRLEVMAELHPVANIAEWQALSREHLPVG